MLLVLKLFLRRPVPPMTVVVKVIGEHPWGSLSNQRIVANLLGGDE